MLLGSEQAFQQAPELWQNQWQQTVKLLQQGFAWPIQQLANYYAEHAADLITLRSPTLIHYGMPGRKPVLTMRWMNL